MKRVKSLLGVEKVMYIYIKMSWDGLLLILPNIMVPGRKETRALFPHLSPPLPPPVSHPLSPLLHCFPMPVSLFGFPEHSAAHRTSTRSQEHGKYVPTQFWHAVMFSKSCAANRAAWSQVSRRQPEEVQLSAETSIYTNVWLVWVSEGRYR